MSVCLCVSVCDSLQDWWNSRNLYEYLRTWNPITHEWIKAYLHCHLKKWLPPMLAMLTVLILSAFEHDFLISCGIGVFMPIYLVEYGIGGGHTSHLCQFYIN